jgi:hypothetical protein
MKKTSIVNQRNPYLKRLYKMPENLNKFKKPVTKFLEIDILSSEKFNQTCGPGDFRFPGEETPD